MASIEMPMPTSQPLVTSQVPHQAATNNSVNVTNPLINGTNQGAGGHPTGYEQVCPDWRGRLAATLGQPEQSVGQLHW